MTTNQPAETMQVEDPQRAVRVSDGPRRWEGSFGSPQNGYPRCIRIAGIVICLGAVLGLGALVFSLIFGGGDSPFAPAEVYKCNEQQALEGCDDCSSEILCKNCTIGFETKIKMVGDPPVEVTTCGFSCVPEQSSAGCTECSDKLTCTRCAEDDDPYRGRCNVACSDSNIAHGCDVCENFDTCIECKEGMDLKDGICTVGCTDDQASRRCTHCSSAENCTQCESGYMVQGGDCVHRCVFNRETDLDEGAKENGQWLEPKIRNGFKYADMCVDEKTANFFGVGDWGGAWKTALGRDDGWVSGQYGAAADHTHRAGRILYEYNSNGMDKHAQKGIADQMHEWAVKGSQGEPPRRPRFILNVGDSFYFGGFEETGCGGDPKATWNPPHNERWNQVFEYMYNIPHPAVPDRKVPWFSVLGNHDFGGQHFDSGWDHQVYYTYKPQEPPGRWRMPGLYWSQLVNFRHFTLELFMLDGNVAFAMNIKICQHTAPPANGVCKVAGYPEEMNKGNCGRWFHTLWGKQMDWFRSRLEQSKADWTGVVAHYPENCNREPLKSSMQANGVDFCITGHQHHQQIYQRSAAPNECTKETPCDEPLVIVTGGGGGISAESKASEWNSQYGFIDFELTRDKMMARIINAWGKTNDRWRWELKRRKKIGLGEGGSSIIV